MLKPITAMTDHEMLVILLIRYLPPAIDYFRSLNETIEKIQRSVDQVQSVTDSLKETVGDLWDIIGGIFR